jgi:tetratricopeptide (TPR) repeat protein
MYGQAGIYSEADIDIQNFFVQAQFEKHKGNTEKQIELLKEVIKRDDQASAAYYELARANYGIENYEFAQKYALKASALNPENEWYLLILAEIYEASHQYLKASETYTQLISLQPENDIYYHNLAFNQLKLNQPDAAVATLEKLQYKIGVNEETSRRIFDILSKSGNTEKALLALHTLIDAFPDNHRFYNNLASYLHDLGREDEALMYFKKVLELDPNNANASLAIERNSGNSFSENSKIGSLEGLISNMNIPLDRKIQELMPYMSNMTKDGENTQALLDMSNTLLKLYPNEAKTYSVRADILFYSADFANAEKAYAKAIALDDTKFPLWDQWMLNLWELEDYTKLEKKSLKAMDLFPNQVNAYIFHAIALNQNKKTPKALAFLEEAKFMSGNNKNYLDATAIVAAWFDKSSQSKEHIESIIGNVKLSNINNQIYFEFIGDLYQSVSDPVKSKEFWMKAINFGANENRINRKMGV